MSFRWENLKLNTRFGIIILLVVLVFVSTLGYIVFQNRKQYTINEASIRMHSHVEELRKMLDLYRVAKQESLEIALALAMETLENAGEVDLDYRSPIYATATNMDTQSRAEVEFFPLTIDGISQYKNYRLVDRIQMMGNVTSSIFQKTDQGYLTLSTTIIGAGGERATDTFIPNTSEVAVAASAGESYYGRTLVGNTHYLAAYEPIFIGGDVVGMIWVGVPELVLSEIQQFFNQTNYYGNGYPYLFDLNGRVLIHPSESGTSIAQESFFQHVRHNLEGELTISWPQEQGSLNNKQMFFKFFEAYGVFVAANIYHEEYLGRPLARIGLVLGIGTLITVLLLFFVLRILISRLTKPFHHISQVLEKLSAGELVNKVDFSRQDEIGEIYKSLNKLIDGLHTYAEFAKEIGKNNFSSPFTMLGDKDIIGKALLDMRDNLKHAQMEEAMRKTEDAKRNWSTEGYARFAEILRTNNDNLAKLSFEIIRNLVQYLKVNQGGLFVINDDSSNPVLEMTACYAYDRQKFLTKTLEPGEGLTGTCYLERETIYLKQVPQDYINITSGLGEATPDTLLLVPLKVNAEVYGVIELAAFRELEQHEIDFVEKVAESIASTLSAVKINIRTALLLEQSQQQSEEMRAQEEEMRQNMEEMQATQEEMARKEAELSGLFKSINDSYLFAEFKPDGTVINVNKNFLALFGMQEDDMMGHNHAEFDTLSQNPAAYQKFWNDLQSGTIIKKDSETALPEGTIWLAETYSPVMDKNGQITKVILLARDITEAKLQADEVVEKSKELASQQEELRQNMEEMKSQEEELRQTLENMEQNRQETEILKESMHTMINGIPGIVYQCLPDETLTMTFINNNCKKATGYIPEDFISRKISFANLIHQDDRSKLHKAIDEASDQDGKFHVGCRLKNKKGKYLQVEMHGTLQRDAQNRVIGLLGIILEQGAINEMP